MANSVVTKKTNEISVQGAQALVSSVKEGMKLVSQGYLAITPDVAKLYDCKGYKALGYKNFDELCAMEFGMSHGTTVGIRKVFAKYGSVSKENKYTIPEKYLEFGYTKLLLFTDKKFEEAGIDPIEVFHPDMTMAEMKEVLTSKLEDKAAKQDKEAIDTTGKEEAQAQEEAQEEAQAQAQEEEQEEAQPSSDKDNIEYLIKVSKEVQASMKEYLKPEKAILWEGILANLKDLKKLAK